MVSKQPVRILPQLLKEWRRALGLSQTDLAAILEVKQSTIAHWERGARPIPHGVWQELRNIEIRFYDLVDKYLERAEEILENEPNPFIEVADSPLNVRAVMIARALAFSEYGSYFTPVFRQ